MGLANWLTVLRIVLIPVFVSLMVYRKPGAGLLVFAVAALTDLLDGWVARRSGPSRLGAFLDPMADKLLLTASFVTLTYMRVLPFWIAAVVLSRDVILVVGALLIHMLGGRLHPPPPPPRPPAPSSGPPGASRPGGGPQSPARAVPRRTAAHGATPEEDRESAYYR